MTKAIHQDNNEKAFSYKIISLENLSHNIDQEDFVPPVFHTMNQKND